MPYTLTAVLYVWALDYNNTIIITTPLLPASRGRPVRVAGLRGALPTLTLTLPRAAGLYAWRDRVARERDESTGYMLPKAALGRLAARMPASRAELRAALDYRGSPRCGRSLFSLLFVDFWFSKAHEPSRCRHEGLVSQ